MLFRLYDVAIDPVSAINVDHVAPVKDAMAVDGAKYSIL